MKRQPLTSRALRNSASPARASTSANASTIADAQPTSAAQAKKISRLDRYRNEILFALTCAALTFIFFAPRFSHPAAQHLTQKQLDAAVMHTLENNALPSQAARAAEIIAPSVVRVRGFSSDEPNPPGDEKKPSPDAKQIETPDEEDSIGVGSGVVIKDDGTILTNLHVVIQAKKLRVTFHNGFEADAEMIGAQPEHDLAVIKAKALPDDLQAATMRSTNDLRVGDLVVATGFPFGIGPSTSAGVISGLKREYRSPEGKRVLSNLIQFDAAANPGNSGGPLVTAEGEVVGIVTGILNPTSQRVFIGIGFAVPIENAASSMGMSPF